MSHRVTITSEMTNREYLVSALKKHKIEYKERGNQVDLLSGAYNGASVDLSTGRIVSGDTDHYAVDAGKLGLLRQAYAEEKFRAVALKEGHMINERLVEKNGDITLIVQRA